MSIRWLKLQSGPNNHEKKALNTKVHCLLCEKIPTDGLHVKGAKLIQKKLVSYGLCMCCSLPNGRFEPTKYLLERKGIWEKVEMKLRSLHKVKTE